MFNTSPIDSEGVNHTSALPFRPTHCPLSPQSFNRPDNLPKEAEPCPAKRPDSRHYRWNGTVGRQHSVQLDCVTPLLYGEHTPAHARRHARTHTHTYTKEEKRWGLHRAMTNQPMEAGGLTFMPGLSCCQLMRDHERVAEVFCCLFCRVLL